VQDRKAFYIYTVVFTGLHREKEITLLLLLFTVLHLRPVLHSHI